LSSVHVSLLVAYGFIALAQGKEECLRDTGGSCAFLGCRASRGPTVCYPVALFVHRCLCQPGYCAHEGSCKPSGGAGPAPAPAPLPKPVPGHAPAPAPVPLPGPERWSETCKLAYAHGCYAKPPFKSCCHGGACQGGYDKLTCKWGWEMACCSNIFDARFTTFKFDAGSEIACQEACNALGDTSNYYLDYCPGGKIRAAVASCPAALRSLEQAFGTKEWCKSQRTMTCDWTYFWYSKVAKKKLMVSASFHFEGSSTACVDACGALGQGSNSQDMYCANTKLAEAVSRCPEAKASFDMNHGSWCKKKTGEVSLVQASGRHEIRPAVRELGSAAVRAPTLNQSIRSSPALSALAEHSDDYDQECHHAFTKGCWKEEPFSSCCKVCSSASYAFSCAWRFTFGDTTIGKQMKAFKGEPWAGCQHACRVLGNQGNDPEDYCGDKRKLLDQIKRCVQAPGSLEKASADATWCKKSKATETMLSRPGQPRLGVVAAIAAALAAAAAALVVKRRARRFAGEEGYQQFLE